MDFGQPKAGYLRCPACHRTGLKLVSTGVWDGKTPDGYPTFSSFRFARCVKCGAKYGYWGPHTASLTMDPMTDDEWERALRRDADWLSSRMPTHRRTCPSGVARGSEGPVVVSCSDEVAPMGARESVAPMRREVDQVAVGPGAAPRRGADARDDRTQGGGPEAKSFC